MNMLKFGFTIFLLTAVSVCAQKPTPTRERSIAVGDLLNRARIAAPEIGTDTMTRLVGSGMVIDREWRIEILEEANRIAKDVRTPVRQTSVPIKGVSVDTHAGYLTYAYDLGLDQLSLRSRIIKQMLRTDPARARQLVFELGGKIDLERLKCADALVYDVSEIYSVVTDVAKGGFSQEEIADGSRALYVVPWFENIVSPAQIGPALSLLTAVRASQLERQLLYHTLAKAINRNFDDDRSFTYAIERDGLVAKVVVLASGADDAQIKAELVEAFRGFILKNTRSSRCKDNEINLKSNLPRYVADANYLFREKPLTVDETVSSEIKEGPKVVHYWKSAQAIRFQQEFRVLRTMQPEKLEDEWAAKVGAFAEKLDDWQPSDNETESEVFNQKCVLYRILLGLSADEPLKKNIFRRFLRFLSKSPLQKQNVSEWLVHVRWLAASDPPMFNDLEPEFPSPNFRLIVESKKLGL